MFSIFNLKYVMLKLCDHCDQTVYAIRSYEVLADNPTIPAATRVPQHAAFEHEFTFIFLH